MDKIKNKAFDIIIIFGLIFLIMQISVITSDQKNEVKKPAAETVQTTPPLKSSGNPVDAPKTEQKQISSDQEIKDDNSIDL